MLRHRLSLREDGDIIPFAQISVTVISNILMSDRRIKICKLVDVSIFKNQTLFHLPIYVCMYGWRPSLSTLYHRWTRTWLNYSHVHELQLKLGKTPTGLNKFTLLYVLISSASTTLQYVCYLYSQSKCSILSHILTLIATPTFCCFYSGSICNQSSPHGPHTEQKSSPTCIVLITQ